MDIIENYKNYLNKKLCMPLEDADLFLSGFDLVNYKKGDYLLKQGDKNNIVKIILSGSARGFVIIDGNEFTTNFYFENDHAYDYVNYLNKHSSGMYIKALENITNLEMSFEATDFLSQEIIGYYKMSFYLFKENFIKVEKERKNHILKSPKERYLDLVKNHQNIISKVPQYQLASFIGISPEHLSRLRREIAHPK
ncbi:MAG: hypothetical protein WC140_06435 [Bacteroidales bacterium]